MLCRSTNLVGSSILLVLLLLLFVGIFLSFQISAIHVVPETYGVRSVTSLRGSTMTTTSTAEEISSVCRNGNGDNVTAVLNDNFCDCLDGSDEPGTSACSHLRPAIRLFYCSPIGSVGDAVFLSRVRDGICDCRWTCLDEA